MSQRTAITVNRPRDEVERLWSSDLDADVTFLEAPGDRGTEIHVALKSGNKLTDSVRKITGDPDLAKVRDELRHFKQRIETGEIARSDGTPEGESVGRKFKQRPAQPLEEAGVR
jgi:hypothetical protein